MTLAYSLNFVAWFVLWPIGVFALPTLVGLYIPLGVAHGAPAWIWVAVAATALLVYMVLVIHHTSRLRIRSGAAPVGCYRTPATPQALAGVLKQIKGAHVVSGGWGMFLQRRGADPRRRVFMSSLTGRAEAVTLARLENPNAKPVQAESSALGTLTTWLAGTPIAHVNEYLKQHGLTLPHSPTMQYIGVGAWAATFSHGNEGPKGQAHVITSVYVAVDGKIKKMKYRDFAASCGIEVLDLMVMPPYDLRTRKLVVVAVELAAVRNSSVQKSLTVINWLPDMREWLAIKSQMRLLFFGTARAEMLGLAWEQVDFEDWKAAPHKDPHPFSKTTVSNIE